jgi:hypothetical protein
VTWWGQGKLIDFCVRRTTGDITLALTLLLAPVVGWPAPITTSPRSTARHIPALVR